MLFKNGDAKDSLTLPRTNVDNFKFVYPKLKYDSDKNFPATGATGYNDVYSYDNLVAAVALFPAFCDV